MLDCKIELPLPIEGPSYTQDSGDSLPLLLLGSDRFLNLLVTEFRPLFHGLRRWKVLHIAGSGTLGEGNTRRMEESEGVENGNREG